MKDSERLRPDCRHCVFYLFKASLLLISATLAVDFAIGCFYFVPTCLLIWMTCFWLRAFVRKAFFDHQAGFLWLEFFLLVELLSVAAFSFLFGVCLFSVCLSGFSSEFELLSITPFSHPDVSFPPCFPLCYSPCFCNASWEPGNGVRCRG